MTTWIPFYIPDNTMSLLTNIERREIWAVAAPSSHPFSPFPLPAYLYFFPTSAKGREALRHRSICAGLYIWVCLISSGFFPRREYKMYSNDSNDFTWREMFSAICKSLAVLHFLLSFLLSGNSFPRKKPAPQSQLLGSLCRNGARMGLAKLRLTTTLREGRTRHHLCTGASMPPSTKDTIE